MFKIVLMLLWIVVKPIQLSDNNSGQIRVIDIFTNYPTREEALKEYQNVHKRRIGNTQMNATSRSYNDFDYYDRYRPYDDYYGDRYPGIGNGDILESEFGVFDDRKNYASDYSDKYVYIQGQQFNDYPQYIPKPPKRPHIYPQEDIDDEDDDDDQSPDNFKNKLDKFIAEVQKRPSFQTKKNYSMYGIGYDQFNFRPDDKLPDYFQNVVHNDFGNFATVPEKSTTTTTTSTTTTTPKPTRRRKPGKKNRPRPNDAEVTHEDIQSNNIIIVSGQVSSTPKPDSDNRNRVTEILRKYLVKMHKKKDVYTDRIDRKQLDRTIYNTIGKFFDDKKTQLITDYKLDALDSGKFITQPFQSLKNKTMKFANKFLSLFTVIQFSNARCQASSALSDYEGTCYLATECASLDGLAMGNCAEGHGVCCVFKGTCGDVGSQNCTYFESPGYPNYYPLDQGVVTPMPETTTNSLVPDPRFPLLFREGRQNMADSNALSCIFRVYKANDNIKQIRIDFIDLELSSPTNGVCMDERLVIAGTGINQLIPILCGYNTGSHIYIDVSGLSGPLSISVLATAIRRKRYKMRICQYSDGCSGLMNCLQYYTGIMGSVASFNYDQAAQFNRSTPSYLNSLNYAICIRREPGYCTITYTTTGPNNVQYPFQLRNFEDDGLPTIPMGQAGVGVLNCPDDYIVINGIRLCGDRLNDGSTNPNFALNAPVTDVSGGPIILPVRTSSTQNGRGFRLFYTQNRCPTAGVPDPRLRYEYN